MRIEDLQKIFSDEEYAFTFAISNNLIDNKKVCSNNHEEKDMVLNKSIKMRQKLIWRCNICNKTCSVLKGSIFYNSKLPISKVLFIVYMWAYEFSIKKASHESLVSEHTISSIYRQIQDSILTSISTENCSQIGGPECNVEIDETLLTKRKYNQGRIIPENWVFGGICRETNEFFIESVPDRKGETLIDCIYKNIRIGTNIVSDQWSGYNNLDREPFPQPFTHESVNHKENFVNPETGANTQKMERFWRDFKTKKGISQGIQRKDIEAYIAEYKWRRSIKLSKKDIFFSACKILSETKFE